MDFFRKIAKAFGWSGSEHHRNFLDEYRIVRKLGEGSMGQVHLARHRETGKLMAIKEQNPDNYQERRRVEKEIQVGTSIEHENVCRIHAYQKKGGTYSLLLDFIDGRSMRSQLRDWTIKQKKEPPFVDAENYLNIFHRMADVLRAIHEAGYLHLDVKPGNIMVEERKRNGREVLKPYLIDFGIAVEESESVDNLKGSLFYMSPEAAGAGTFSRDQIDHRSDIYSLGATMYELATGRPPHLPEYFSNRDEHWNRAIKSFQKLPRMVRREHKKQMLRDRIQQPVDFDRFPYSDELAEVTRSCLKIAFGKRYPHTSLLLKDLRAIQEGENRKG